MFRNRTWIMAVLVQCLASVANAEDYVLPTGVTVLTEEQLINQLFGSTTYNRRWSEYCEPPSDDERVVKLRGKHQKYGQYVGRCVIKGQLFCWEIDTPPMSKYSGECYSLALDGELITKYKTDGKEFISRWGRVKLASGNPENL